MQNLASRYLEFFNHLNVNEGLSVSYAKLLVMQRIIEDAQADRVEWAFKQIEALYNL